MSDVAEAFFETAMEKAVYQKMNPKIVGEVFLGMFAVAGLSQNTIMEPNASASKCRNWLKDSRIFF
jgi:hypothetical protein